MEWWHTRKKKYKSLSLQGLVSVQSVVSRISAMEDTTVDPEGFISSLCSFMVNMVNRMGHEIKIQFPSMVMKSQHSLRNKAP